MTAFIRELLWTVLEYCSLVMLYRIIYLNKKHCFTIQKKRSKLLHHNKLIISHIKQTNIRYSAAHLWFMSWALPDKNYVFIIFQISAHCIYWEERLALEYFPTLLRVKIDFFLCSCYRHLPDVDETACSTIRLPEENCVAVQYMPGCLEYISGKVASYSAWKEKYKLFTIMQH